MFDGSSFGDGVHKSTLALPPSLGGEVEIEVYLKDREQIHLVEKSQYNVIDLKGRCIRTSFKDPDQPGTRCDDSPWIKPEDFRKEEVKYVGTIKEEGAGFKFIPAN